MTRLNHNDEATLRLILKEGSPDGHFSAPLSMLAGVFAEIDNLRAMRPVAIAAADAQANGEPLPETVFEAVDAMLDVVEADEFAPHEVPASAADDLL